MPRTDVPAEGQQPAGLVARATAIAFARIFIGAMWLIEITVGHNWKIGHPQWMGAGAGEYVRDASQTAIADGTYAGAAWVFEAIVIPNAAIVGYATIGLQLILALAFIVGFAVRPLALAALVMDFAIFMLGNSRIPPFFSAAHIFLLVSGAGRYYGVDGLILSRTRQTTNALVRAARWAIELPVFRRSYLVPAIAVTGFVALFFFLSIPSRETTRFANVGLDLAALFGLVTLGLYAATRIPDHLGVLAAGLRIFVGFKLLHEIWTRTAPGINALPGFAGAETQTTVFETVAASHWPVIGGLVSGAILPYIGFWVAAFAIVQFAVGVMLVVGYQTRLASIVGLFFLGAMIALGLTRYAPFLFGLLVPVLALDAGRYLSLDSVRAAGRVARYGLPIPQAAVPVLIGLAALSAVAALAAAVGSGLVPDGYTDSMPGFTALFGAVFLGLLAFAGWLQRHPRLDSSAAVVPPEPEMVLQPTI
jgi:hypothetical protein